MLRAAVPPLLKKDQEEDPTPLFSRLTVFLAKTLLVGNLFVIVL